jgi:hypothetical protein
VSEKNYVVNVKNKAGTIFTVRGDSAAELVANITDTIAHSAHEAVAALEELLLQGTPSAPIDFGQFTQPQTVVSNPVDAVLSAVGGTVISTQSTGVAPTEFAPVAPPVQAAPVGVDTVEDRWGNKWTYGRADAPICPNGPMVLKQGTNQSGKPYVGFFDPAGGPRWQGAKIPTDQQTAPKFGVKV